MVYKKRLRSCYLWNARLLEDCDWTPQIVGCDLAKKLRRTRKTACIMALEFIPIAAIMGLLTEQVIKTAQAATDIVFEKESFKILAKHLSDIQLVLTELQLKPLPDSPAIRKALEKLEEDINTINSLVDKYKNRSRFYLLIKCRSIVNEVQEVTRNVGRSLAVFSLANTEVLCGISDQVERLQNEMQRVEFEASQTHLQIVDKLDQGLRDRKLDQGFANDMLEEIARAVGVSVEPSEIGKELASFRREKEEAADRKERAEVLFLEQVIELLSRADAAKDFEEVKERYFQRLQFIEKYGEGEESISPLEAFKCCLTRSVMVDPVSLCTGTTCERTAIESWFDMGKRTDPDSGKLLEDVSFRSNLSLKSSIEEWKERNYCLKIRNCKAKLLSECVDSIEEALAQMQELLLENSVNKDWVSVGGLTDIIVSVLRSHCPEEVKGKIFITLHDVIADHTRNKEKFIELQGLHCIISSSDYDPSISKSAIELLYELLQDRSGWNLSFCKVFSVQPNAFLFLIIIFRGPDRESAKIAEKILMKLCSEDDNIMRAAQAKWFKPVIDRIIEGPESSRLSLVKALVSMELTIQDIRLLGEEGVIPPLLEMIRGNTESKELSLSAFVKLGGCPANKQVIAASGGVALIIREMLTLPVRPVIVAKCAEVLEKLSSDEDGIIFFVDESGAQLELAPLVKSLIAFQLGKTSSHAGRKPALRTLLAICKSDTRFLKTAVLSGDGVHIIISLIDDFDKEVQHIALHLLYLFSQLEPDRVVEYLFLQRRLERLVGFLGDTEKNSTQMAAAGLLANLPKSEVLLTKKLMELEALDAILNVLEKGPEEAVENALSVLFRFMDPENVEFQKTAVDKGVYPLLISCLNSGSITAKANAAALIGNLSRSSPKLTKDASRISFCCFNSGRSNLCPAHGGLCAVDSSFCLLEANALPELVKLLNEKNPTIAYEVIPTISTLVGEDSPQKGANVLHEADAITPLLGVLDWGTDILKDETLKLLENILKLREMIEIYGSAASLAIANIIDGSSSGREAPFVQRAARVLPLLRSSRFSSSLVQRVLNR